MNGTMDHQAQLVQYRLSTLNGHKSPGTSRFHNRIHLPRTRRCPRRTLDDTYGQVIIASPKGDILKYGVQLKFPLTNNEAEYETILTGLRIAQALKAKNALLRSDSQLVIGQVKGDFEAKETRM